MVGRRNRKLLWEINKRENIDTQNQKAAIQTSWTHNEEKRLRNLTLTAHTENKNCRGKQQVAYLMKLRTLMAEQGVRGIAKRQKLLRSKKDRKVWRAKNTHVLKGYSLEKKRKDLKFLWTATYLCTDGCVSVGLKVFFFSLLQSHKTTKLKSEARKLCSTIRLPHKRILRLTVYGRSKGEWRISSEHEEEFLLNTKEQTKTACLLHSFDAACKILTKASDFGVSVELLS